MPLWELEADKKLRLAVIVSVPCAVLIVFLLREYISGISQYFPECILYSRTGIYCPGCGNTRSVKALLRGKIVLSLRNNAAVPFLSLLAVLLYGETVCRFFGISVRFLPRKLFFWIYIIIIFMVYYVLRNFIPIAAPI